MQHALKRRRMSPSILILGAALMVTAWAFAASTASAALPGYQRVVASSERTSFNKGAVAKCPAGLNVVGAGGEVSTGFGEVVIEDVIPDPSLKTVTVNAREQQGGVGLVDAEDGLLAGAFLAELSDGDASARCHERGAVGRCCRG